MSKHEYYQQLADYWFSQLDYETCAYYRTKAAQVLKESLLEASRRSHLENVSSSPTLIISNPTRILGA